MTPNQIEEIDAVWLHALSSTAIDANATDMYLLEHIDELDNA